MAKEVDYKWTVTTLYIIKENSNHNFDLYTDTSRYSLEEYMSEHSAFDKLHVDEREKADLGGILEQFNLPPNVIEFVRKHQRTIYITLSVIAVVVVFYSLYSSHLDKQRTESSSALSMAQQLEGDMRLQALDKVVAEYSGTGSATWANIEIARYYMEKSDFETALQRYTTIREDISANNSLTYLVTFGIAQAKEALGQFDQAASEYQSLKNVQGFESIGYTGTARIYEVQGNLEKAVNEYQQYLSTLGASNVNSAERQYINAKISAIKAQM